MEKPLDQFDFDDFWPNKNENDEVVARFYSVFEANLAASRLRSEGFPCFLANENTGTIVPDTVNVIRLHVRPVDMEEVRLVLADMNADWVINRDAFEQKKGFNAVHAATMAVFLVMFVLLLYALKDAFLLSE